MSKQILTKLSFIAGLLIATLIGHFIIQHYAIEIKTKEQKLFVSNKVKVLQLKATDEPFEFSVFGIVRPVEEAILSSEINGVILTKSSKVFTGLSVKKNEVLFEIYRQDLSLQKERLQKLINKQQIELKELKIQTELNEKELVSQKEILVLSEKENDRMKNLSSGDHIPLNQFEQAKILYLQTKIRTENVESAIQSNPLRKETIEENIKGLDIQTQEIEERINKTTIRAPFDGVIKEVFAEVGVTASPGARLVSLYNAQILEVPVNIRASEKEALENCVDKNQIKLKLFDGTNNIGVFHRYEGNVSSVTKMQTIVFRFNDNKKVLPGEMITATILSPVNEKYFKIRKSLVTDLTVFTVVNNKIKKVKISPRYELKDFFIVYDNLHEGDQIIETPLKYAVEGSPISIVEEPKDTK